MPKKPAERKPAPTPAEIRRRNLKPFQPGQSGNPGGRPKRKPVTEELLKLLDSEFAGDKQKRTGAELLAMVLVKMAITGKGKIDAIREVMDRVEGKAIQRNEHSGPEGSGIPIDLMNASRDEVERMIQELQQKGKRG